MTFLTVSLHLRKISSSHLAVAVTLKRLLRRAEQQRLAATFHQKVETPVAQNVFQVHLISLQGALQMRI